MRRRDVVSATSPIRANISQYGSRGTTIVVVKTAQDWEGDNTPRARMFPIHRRRSRRDRLADPLVWPGVVEVPDIRAEDAPQVRLAQDEDMVQALAPHAAEEALAGRVLPGRAIGRAHLRDARCRGHKREGRPVLAVAIADEVARPLAERRGLAQLLGDSGVRRVTRGTDMHHATGPGRDHDEGVQGPEEQVGDGRKSQAQVCAPWLRGNVAQDWSARHVGRVPRMCR